MLLTRVVFGVLFSLSLCSANTVTIVFTALPTVNQNNTYNGFSTATINGIPNQMLLCDDSADITTMPSGTIIYDYSNLVGPNPLQYARFTAAPEVQNYEEAAVLLYEFAALVNPSNNVVTEYQYAVWNVFNHATNLPATTIPPGNTTLLAQQQLLETNALNLVLSTTQPSWVKTAYADLVVYTPAPNSPTYPNNFSNQEFLGLQNPSAPEPAMVWPLAFLGVALGIAKRVRRRRA
jgi:hypothetical protein